MSRDINRLLINLILKDYEDITPTAPQMVKLYEYVVKNNDVDTIDGWLLEHKKEINKILIVE